MRIPGWVERRLHAIKAPRPLFKAFITVFLAALLIDFLPVDMAFFLAAGIIAIFGFGSSYIRAVLPAVMRTICVKK